MTREEFEKFKLLLKNLEEKNLIEINVNSQKPTVEFKVFEDEKMMEEPIGLSGTMSIKDFFVKMKKAKDYDGLDPNIKNSFADVTNGINKLANKIHKYYEKNDNNIVKEIELEDLYSTSGDTDISLARDVKKLKDFLKQLNDAKTITNSTQYKNVITEVENAISTLGNLADLDSKENLKTYEKAMDKLTLATDKYLEHKANDGIKKNAYDKAAVCTQLKDFSMMNSSRKLMKQFEMTKKQAEGIKNVNGNYADYINIAIENSNSVENRIKNIYKNKDSEIDKVFNKFRHGLNNTDFNVELSADAKKELIASAVVSDIISTEIVYSEGKGTEFTDNIFNSENPGKYVDNLITTLIKETHIINNYYGEKGDLKHDDIMKILMDPIKVFEDARKENFFVFKNAKDVNLSTKVTAERQRKIEEDNLRLQEENVEKERINLEKLKSEERRQEVIDKHHGHVRDAKTWTYLAKMTNDESKKALYTKKANESKMKAFFGEDKKNDVTKVNKKNDMQKTNEKSK